MGEMKALTVNGKISFKDGLQPSFFREEKTPVGSLTLSEFKGLYIKIVFKDFETVISGVVDPTFRMGTVTQVEDKYAADGSRADFVFEIPGYKTATVGGVAVENGILNFGEVMIEPEESA
jgi:hypothetical protein